MNSIYYSYLKKAVLLVILSCPALAQEMKFEYIPFDQGLSQKTIQGIIQDSRGYMWFGILNGLYKYDGYNFTIYKHNINNPRSLSDNNINSLYEDRSGRLWIATNDGGLNLYDRGRDSFVHFKHDPSNPNSISDDRIYAVCEDKSGIIWIGTMRGGLNRFDQDKNQFTHYLHDPDDPKSISNNDIRHIYIDNTGIIWMGTEHGGLCRFNPAEKTFKSYKNSSGVKNSIDNDQIKALCADRSGRLWLSTSAGINILDTKSGKIYRLNPGRFGLKNYAKFNVQSICEDRNENLWFGTGLGLYQYNPYTEKIDFYQHEPGNPNSLSYNCVIFIYQDRSGILWFGTWEGGLNKLNPETKRFGHIKHNPKDENSLSDNRFNVIYQDSMGRIWIGTEGGTLNKLVFDTQKGNKPVFTHYRQKPRMQHGLGYCSISDICMDRKGILWIGTTEDGVCKFSPETQKFSWFKPKQNYYKAYHINDIFEDRTGTIWIGLTAGGVVYYNPVTGNIRGLIHHQPEKTLSLTADRVTTVFEDQSGIIWIGTDSGLNRITLSKGNGLDREIIDVTHYLPETNNATGLSNNDVNVIYEDNSGILWAGTDCGLNKLDRGKDQFIHYFEKDGLPSNEIAGILEDKNGHLWLSTGRGISHFDPKTEVFKNYDITDGLQGSEFKKGAFCKTQDGMMYFGGANGFNRFYPDDIQFEKAPPQIVISDFRILNQSVDIGEEIDGITVLNKSISETEEIELSYKSRVFSLEFSALDFRCPEKNQYAYMLEGFDDDWNYSGTRRFVSYTNLDGGRYTFRVKAASKDDVWNEQGISLNIRIRPPWWKTTWAYILYFIAAAGLIMAVFRFQLYREQLKKEAAFNQMEAEKLQELDQMKSRFFANISHEFRTPLTLILGSAKRLLSGEVQSDAESQYKMQIRNGERLLTLVSQLLDLSKLESGKLVLQTKKDDIIPFIKGILNSFHSYAVEHKIELHFSSDAESAKIYFDPDKMEKIISNLISNAVKFTPPGGTVEVRAKHSLQINELNNSESDRNASPQHVYITVSDTGVGIPPDYLPHIFDRFYQVGNNYVKDQQGSGIGLALTKELVKLHHGEISVKSEEGAGTTFSVLFPLGKDHLKEAEIVENGPVNIDDKNGDYVLLPKTDDDQYSIANIQSSISNNQSPIILVVEDNADMRAYIRDVMSVEYRIEEAADGQEGFDKAAEIIPELIISDVMMPKMDGYQLCGKLKTDERTSHIPVVMLTAKSSGDDKIEGLEQGADDYLVKPFNSAELKVRASNLIEQRRKLRERFSREVNLQPAEIAITPADEAFLQRAIKIIEDRMDDPELSIEWFSKQMGLSRSQLHRKFQAIINQSASEFIRSIRLKRAVQLLEQKAATISEIAYQTGFSSPDYFRKCFREQFGMPPSEYASDKSF